jgi:hypothetical protein
VRALSGKTVLPLMLAVSCIGLFALASLAGASHPRPKAANTLRLSLVPAFNECTAPNSIHGPPLESASCSPPVHASDFVTVGTPEVNDAPANFEGFLKFRGLTGAPGTPDDSGIIITAGVSDVRCKSGTTACGNANDTGGPDYTGGLQGVGRVRLTDHYNAMVPGGGTDAATVVDIAFPINLECASTADPSTGGICNANASSCLGCMGGIEDGRRTTAELSEIQVFDGGADGLVQTDGNTLFAVEGVFVP